MIGAPNQPSFSSTAGDDAINHFVRFPKMALNLKARGLNEVTLELPYHFRRRPRARLGAASNFLSADIFRTAQASAQAVAELRTLIRWLRAQGCPRVGLFGISLGGWLSGLTACHEPLDALALAAPVTRLDRAIEEMAFCKSIRLALRGQVIHLGGLNLIAQTPLVPREKILLIEATHDLFIPRETVEALWESWGRPEIWRVGMGHVTVLDRPGMTRRIEQLAGGKSERRRREINGLLSR